MNYGYQDIVQDYLPRADGRAVMDLKEALEAAVYDEAPELDVIVHEAQWQDHAAVFCNTVLRIGYSYDDTEHYWMQIGVDLEVLNAWSATDYVTRTFVQHVTAAPKKVPA
jgi:hypothetical protein